MKIVVEFDSREAVAALSALGVVVASAHEHNAQNSSGNERDAYEATNGALKKVREAVSTAIGLPESVLDKVMSDARGES